MLLRALKQIPGSIQIWPGQEFHSLDQDETQQWIKDGLAEPIEKALPLGWSGGLDWRGCEVLIIASGPSLMPEQVTAAKKWRASSGKRRVMVINTTFRLAYWADVLYACDARWWAAKHVGSTSTYYEEAAELFQGELWTQSESSRPLDFPKVKVVKSERSPGLNRSNGIVNTGMHSGYQAIGLAWQAGARKLYLLGYDCREPNGKSHWHGDHPKTLKSKNQYAMWLVNYVRLAEDLTKDTKVTNLTPGSAIHVFPMQSWQETLR